MPCPGSEEFQAHSMAYPSVQELSLAGTSEDCLALLYQVRFCMADDVEIKWPDNAPSDVERGLVPGQRGSIVVRALADELSFEAGQKFQIVFYRFRPQDQKMDLASLLDIVPVRSTTRTPTPFSVEMKRDRNPYTTEKTGKVDCLLVKVHSPASEIRIPYLVKPPDTAPYGDDSTTGVIYGRFSMMLFLSGSKPTRKTRQYDAYLDGAWLRKAL